MNNIHRVFVTKSIESIFQFMKLASLTLRCSGEITGVDVREKLQSIKSSKDILQSDHPCDLRVKAYHFAILAHQDNAKVSDKKGTFKIAMTDDELGSWNKGSAVKIVGDMVREMQKISDNILRFEYKQHDFVLGEYKGINILRRLSLVDTQGIYVSDIKLSKRMNEFQVKLSHLYIDVVLSLVPQFKTRGLDIDHAEANSQYLPKPDSVNDKDRLSWIFNPFDGDQYVTTRITEIVGFKKVIGVVTTPITPEITELLNFVKAKIESNH